MAPSLPSIDPARERALTPGVQGRAFLDSAGSSLMPTPVVDAVVAHLRREAEVGGYRAAAERADDLAALPDSIGRLLGVDASTIALTDSATRAWTQFVASLRLGAGDRVLVAGNEYASNAIALLQQARHAGCVVERVPTRGATIDLDALATALERPTRLVSLVHVATNSGTIAPVAEAARMARAAGALVVLDACQSVGQLDVRVAGPGASQDGLQVDALSATGRKWLRGPRGTGFLHVRADLAAILEPPGADLRAGEWTAPDDYRLHGDARRFEQWEHDVAARLGLKAAVDHLLALGPAAVEAAVVERAAALRGLLAGVPGVRLHDVGDRLGAIVTFTVDGVAPDVVRDRLLDAHVHVSVSWRSSTLLDMDERGLDAVVRASPHYFVDDADLDRTVDAVTAIASAH